MLSWELVAKTAASENQFATVVPGALRFYDLPDLAASLAPRLLAIRHPTDATGQAARPSWVTDTYAPVRAAYAKDGMGARFTLHGVRPN